MNDDERCPGTNRKGERCGHPQGWGTDNETGPCKFHGGASPGAPEGNQNAMKTGLHSDPVGLFEWLKENEPDAAAWILAKLWDYAEDAPKPVFALDVDGIDSLEEAELHLTAYGDDVLQLCVRDYARWRAAKRQLVEGVISWQEKATEHGTVKVEDSNPVNLDLNRMDQTVTRLKKEADLLPDPDSQKAEAIGDLATIIAEESDV